MTEIKNIIEEVQGLDLAKSDAIFKLNEILNKTPSASWIKENPYTKSKYIPIRILETLMRSIFGQFQSEQPHPAQLIGNSVIAYERVRYFHPVHAHWMNLDGIGAVPIQMQKGASPTDFSKINAQGLHKVVPAAVGFARSNALKKLGRLFGSELNAEDTIDLIDIKGANNRVELSDNKLNEANESLKGVGNLDDLSMLYQSYPELSGASNWESMVARKRNSLNSKTIES
jgi:hypothetical protein